MRDDIKQLMPQIQASMVESAKLFFVEAVLDDLCCLIRVTGEFFDYLQVASAHSQPRPKNEGSGVKGPLLQSITAGMPSPVGSIKYELADSDFDLSYAIETVFSGVDSFCIVSAAYRGLVGPTSSTINWDKLSVSAFNEQFTSKFHEFAAASNFEKQCRLLLDLFKLAIVFAGYSYN